MGCVPKIVARIGAVLLILSAAPAPVSACGFDGVIGASLSAQHPKSLAVAFALRDAVDSGALDRTALAPIERVPKGYWRAAAHVQELQRRLAGAKTRDAAPSLALLFIESQLWSRLKPTATTFDLELHAAGAEPQDVVIVTNETVLASLLDGSLSAQAALDRGLVALDGEPSAVAVLREILLESMSRPADRASPMSLLPFTGAKAKTLR
ncbi:MAG: hypothetical protein WAK01_20685 [Methylocystis sp.]